MIDKENNVCFVISPIDEKDSKTYKKFKEVLDFIIKPAVEYSSYELKVLRADDIKKPGLWINDILKNIYSSFIVIADLTDQNPNVFYELGVRHSLSPRTILIAQTIDDIPSDLRNCRSIIYEMTLEGAHKFKQDLSEYLKEIYQNPNQPDNPVIDNLKYVTDNQIKELKSENISLRNQIKRIKKISKEIQEKCCPSKNIDEIEENDSNIKVKGEIIEAYGNKILYEICPNCNKRVTFVDNSYICDVCEEEIEKPNYLMIIPIVIEDKTGTMRVTFFRKAAEELIEMTTSKIKDVITKTGDEGSLEDKVMDLVGREITIIADASFDDYNEKIRLNAKRVLEIETL